MYRCPDVRSLIPVCLELMHYVAGVLLLLLHANLFRIVVVSPLRFPPALNKFTDVHEGMGRTPGGAAIINKKATETNWNLRTLAKENGLEKMLSGFTWQHPDHVLA